MSSALPAQVRSDDEIHRLSVAEREALVNRFNERVDAAMAVCVLARRDA